ncbi:MAG: putative prohead protease [Prokaryotic dsDNA virus sp.]|nr:MAG: putative prohead protease [Prokaryotic dsDNA virus sp.]|tara:strand:- start:6448 stop:7863 length:1416 start_codon:yes stop_codon:yes gene_type:complete
MAKYRGEEIDLKPTEQMASNATKGLEWRKEFGRGGTDVGVARATQLKNREELSADTVRRMVSYFARHEVDKEAEGFNSGEEGFPSAGRIAWELWGGDAGKSWADSKDKQLDKIDSEKGFNDMTMKRMVVGFEVKDVKEADDGFYTFEGYASTYGNLDRGDDIVMSGAFDETMKDYSGSEKLPVLWQHSHDMPIGVYDEIRSDSKGLWVKGRMPKDDDFVKGRVMPQMRVGSIRKMSIGYSIDDYEWDGNIRKLKRLKLWEVSLVTIPMNNSADVTGFKSAVPYQDLPLADRDRAWDSTMAMGRFRELLDSEDEPSEDYRKAFLWFDRENASDFGAYKLPIADVIDGRLVAVPRAIFAAAAALSGARGGVDIPDADRQTVVNNVNRYYEKMGMESPFQEKMCFRIDDFEAFTERELEKLFKSGVYCQGEKARMLVSAHKSLMRDADESKKREADDADILTELKRIQIAIKGE